MGFPVGYSELFFPKVLLRAFFVLGLIRKMIHGLFMHLGLPDFLESDNGFSEAHHPLAQPQPHAASVSATVIREILPVVKFDDLCGSGDTPDSCAVCLYEFQAHDEIRQLTNCCHIFHRACLDPWMDHDQKTCPLCRNPFVPDPFQQVVNDWLCAASALPNFCDGLFERQIETE